MSTDQARTLLAAIVESSDDAIVSKTLQGVVTSWNPSAERIFGYSAAEMVGRSITTIIPPDRLREEEEFLARLSRGERIEHYETVRRRKDGRAVDVSVTLSPLRDAAGVIVGASKIARDVTERTRARARLHAQAESWRVTLASIGDAVIATDGEGRVTFMNPVAETLCGWSMAEAAGRRLDEVFVILNETTRRPAIDPVHRVLREGVVVGLANHTVLVARDGGERPIDDSAAPIRDPHGRITGVVLVFRDVSDRRRAEAALQERETRFRTMADSAPVMIWMAGPDGACEFFNRTWLEFTGRTLPEVLGDRWQEAIHPEDRPRWVETYLTASGARRSYRAEYRLRRADGEYRWLLDAGVPRFDAEGRFTGYIGSCVDITDRRAAEAERAQLLSAEQAARAEAERANQAKDAFLASLSHELRTPLNSILGWARLLRTGTLDGERQRRALDSIERNSQLQVQLIEDLLDVSRIATGKLDLATGPIDLGAVIESALDLVRAEAEARPVRLETAIDPAARAVIGDAGRLQQVVWNLLANALRFTPPGGRVSVTLTRAETRVLLTVADTGLGISPDVLPHIFERFRQGRPAGRSGRRGLGLGLAIVRQIVELHRGSVQAFSAGEGKGATFVVSLPVTAATRGQAAAAGAPLPTGFPSLAGVRVLLVEDDVDGRRMLAEVLRQCGGQVVEAGSAREALEAFEAGRIDVVVSDIGLPDQDGYQLVRALRARPPERGGLVPALAVTAFARVEDRHRALLGGFQTHVSKPVEPLELAVAVANLAGRQREGR